MRWPCSGGATRAAFDDMGAVSRGLHGAEFDATKRPETSDVAQLDDLIALAKSEGWQEALATRDLDAGGSFLPDAKGYVLMAACRPSESAYEASFDGKDRNGALTYWLLEGLRNLRPDSTYQQLHNTIVARVHTRFSQQTPMLLGDANRVVLGSDILGLQPAVNVESVDLATSTLVLNTGDAQGVKTGARFAVFPGGTIDFSDDTVRLGDAEVIVLGAASSTCAIKDGTKDSRAITVGDQAVLLDPTSVRLRRKVGLYTLDDGRKPLVKDAYDRLKAVADMIDKAGKGWVALAHEGDVFEYQVAVVRDHFEIWDSSGRPIPNVRPLVPITDAGGPANVVERLVHLSKYHSIIELDNFDKSSPLRGKLVVELLRAPDGWSPSERPVPIPFKEPGVTPTLKVGEGAFLRMRNNMPKDTEVVLNVTVLNLRPSWVVTRVFPVDSHFMPIAVIPGRLSVTHPGSPILTVTR